MKRQTMIIVFTSVTLLMAGVIVFLVIQLAGTGSLSKVMKVNNTNMTMSTVSTLSTATTAKTSVADDSKSSPKTEVTQTTAVKSSEQSQGNAATKASEQAQTSDTAKPTSIPTSTVANAPKKTLKITEQPQNATGKLNNPVDLKVVAVFDGAMSYQWEWSESNAAGNPVGTWQKSSYPGNATPVLQAKFETNTFFYRVVVTAADGTQVISKAAKIQSISVQRALEIIQQPQKKIIGKPGGSAELSVKISGGIDPKFQWQWSPNFFNFGGDSDWQNSTYPGNQSSTLNVKCETTPYFYRCVITDQNGVRITSESCLVGSPSPVMITRGPPSNLSGKEGDPVSISVETMGGSKPKYQWQWSLADNLGGFVYRPMSSWENSTYPGNNSATLQAKVEDSPYFYRCLITDDDGSQTISGFCLVKKK